MGGVYDYGDGSIDINMADIIYCVENDISREEFDEWSAYIVEATEFGFTTPNLKSWHKGCPRTPQEVFDKLRKAQREFYETVEKFKG